MLLNECINLFVTLPIIANLNRMVVMTKMNASPLTELSKYKVGYSTLVVVDASK